MAEMASNEHTKGCECRVMMNYKQIESQCCRLITNGNGFQGHLSMDSLCSRFALFHGLQTY